MRTPGQRQALDELDRVAAATAGGVVVDEIVDGVAFLTVRVGIDCRGFPHDPTGIRCRQREWFTVFVPYAFPWQPPSVESTHTRWERAPHVQWRRHLCLYQAPGAEWNPSDGMFGFLDRLVDWLGKASLNELDPIGGPLHPPVAYATSGTPLIVPRVDTPALPDRFWFGWARLDKVTPLRHDIVSWHELGTSNEAPEGQLAPAILLAEPLPFEFPKMMGDLITSLGDAGFGWELLYRVLGVAATGYPEGEPLYVVVGTPMRRSADGETRQHLAVWQLPADFVDSFRLMVPKSWDSDELAQTRESLKTSMLKVADHSEVQWCAVREARPEVTADRGEGSPLQWFAERTVALWGCGALGSHVAELLTRAGVRRLVLHDNSTVSPGVLSRQCFDDSDIGRNKALALRDRLERIRPDLDVEARTGNLLTDPGLDVDWTDGADLVIDAAANGSVTKRLERRRMSSQARAPVASMVVGSTAEHSMVTFTPSDAEAGPADTAHQAKLAASRDPGLVRFADEFWPDPPRRPTFQPEPGCSEPTFTGSAAEVAALAAAMLRSVASEFTSAGSHSTAVFAAFQTVDDDAVTRRVVFDRPRLALPDNYCGYQVRIAATALAEIRGWVRRAERVDPGAETGGLLFGERDDALQVLWVTDVLGPPPDSAATPTGFVCGHEGVDRTAEVLSARSRGSSKPVGMWHTHPGGPPSPSDVDHGGMRQLVTDAGRPLPKQLLLIVGGDSDRHTLAAYVYDRDRPPDPPTELAIRELPEASEPEHRIGLALSGGGSRAIAFHLGALRALNDREVLDHVDVVSAVSGGSVVAAMWAYTDEPFNVFDERVTALLRTGLTTDIARRALLTRRAPQALATTAVAGVGKIGATAAALTAKLWNKVRSRPARVSIQPPFRRWVSWTTAFEDVLARRLFGEATIDRPARDVAVVINACELRGGNAFRFGSAESGSSRFGKLADNAVPVARAVAASAAYPVALPALDCRERFIGWDGEQRDERVILTDGGVYDNLGVTCLEPNRSRWHSTNVHLVDFIVSCDAGHGVLDVDTWPLWWTSRMKRSFESVYRKVQDAGKGSLHEHRRSGDLAGFVMPFLGMQDGALPVTRPDLVPRSAVVGYPTNFSPMTEENIALICGRGEQLTRLLIEHHSPNIVC